MLPWQIPMAMTESLIHLSVLSVFSFLTLADSYLELIIFFIAKPFNIISLQLPTILGTFF